MEPPDGDARKKRKGTPAPPAGSRRKPTAAAARRSLAPALSVHMGSGDGGQAIARTRRKTSGAAAPPSLAPPPSCRMAHGDGGAPSARRRRKLTGDADPPSLAPAPSVRMARGDGGAPSSRKRNGPSLLSSRSSPNGSTGGSGGGGTESSAGEDDNREGLTGCDDDHVGTGAVSDSPPAPRRISVAHTPNTPPRFQGLLRNITSLIPYESKGTSYECSSTKIDTFLKWCKSEMVLFFEWNDDEMEMNCLMHDIPREQHIKFTVNAAFSNEMDNVNVDRAAIAFSTNFCGDDKYWSGIKDMLLNMFGSFEDKGLKEYDYLYVFTRVGNSVFFRNFEITSLPKAGNPSSGLMLTEINTMFCLKVVNDHGASNNSTIGQHFSNNQTPSQWTPCQVTYSISNGHNGFCLCHDVNLSGITYSIFVENGSYISSVEKLDGFNRSLAEIVVKEPLLKLKHIIGSVSNKMGCFARERCKSIFQSLFAEFAILLESGSCIGEKNISMHHFLVRGTNVRLYGVDLTDYTDFLASKNVRSLADMVERCFPKDKIPADLHDLLMDLRRDPLDGIQIAKDDCSLMKAKDRRVLLIDINSDYMTNVEAKTSELCDIDECTFFSGCPNLDDWDHIMKDNEYMVQVCNLESSSQENESDDENKDPSVIQRMATKDQVAKNTESIKKFAKNKSKQFIVKGKLQFSSKRNFLMHMPEKARKDGIIPFRLGMSDHILTSYFPSFLRFVQKRMRIVKAQRGLFKKRKRPSYVARG